MRRPFVVAFVCALALTSASAAAAPKPDLRAELGREQLGHINHFVRLAAQPPGEWGDMGILSVSQEGDDGYRYQMAFMSYILGAVQYNHVPAYRELYQRALAAFIEKMRRREVWDYWEDISIGKAWDGDKSPDPNAPAKIADPIVRDNIMYSGHVLQMAALYEMLYRDGRWDKPGSLTLKHLTSNGFATYIYDLPKVVEAVAGQFLANDGFGVACQFNKIFPTSCNQFPILGLMHYDATHGTELAKAVITRHEKAWQKVSALYRSDGETPTPFVMRWRQKDVMANDVTTLAGSVWIRAWNRDYIDEFYPRWRKKFVEIGPDGAFGLRLEQPQFVNLEGEAVGPWPGYEAPYEGVGPEEKGANPQLQHAIALAAAEMGDRELLDCALAYADKNNPPVWKDGELYYERHDGPRFAPTSMTRLGAIFVAGGRLVPKDGFYKLYNEPWTEAELRAPEVRDIEWPKVLVSRARYDAVADALTVTLLPGSSLEEAKPAPVETAFSVVRLDPAKEYRIERDGNVIGRLVRGEPRNVAQGTSMTFAEGVLGIRARLGGSQTYRIAAH